MKTYGKYDESNAYSIEYSGGSLQESSFLLINHGKAVSTPVKWQITGEHQACNAAGAAIVGSLIGLSDLELSEAFANATLSGMRMKKTSLNGVTYLNDAYNANPASMRATLANLKSIAEDKKVILILGDMLELGVDAVNQHIQILRFALENLPESLIIAVGPLMKEAGQNLTAQNLIFAENSLSAGELLTQYTDENTLVFLKGSRGMKLENAIPAEAR